MSEAPSPVPKSAPDRRGRGLTVAALAIATGATLAWLWVCWCLFPVSVWNDVRLAPSLALLRGIDFYPPQDSGIVTTWMYGPLPAILWTPAVLASSAIGALLAAGTINLVLTVAAIAATAAYWPGSATRGQRFAAGLLAILIWPYASFQYLQADNVAIALALFGNLLLVRARRPAHFWIAALLAVAPIMCKQTSVGIAAAQIVWLAVVHGRQAARLQVLRCAVTGVALGLAVFGPLHWQGVWFNMVTVPGSLPWAPDPVGRVVDMTPELLVQLAIPIIILAAARRRIFTAGSPVLLPALTFVCTLPPSLAAFFKFGGTLNSLQGFSLWLPAALLWLVELARAKPALGRQVVLLGAVATVVIAGCRFGRLSAFPTTPFTRHYEQAAQIATEFPGQIWFPWNPLITAYSEGKFYHAEDGMCMRYLANRPLSLQHARAGLPEQIRVIALPKGGTHWGIAVSLKPANAQVQDFGYWTLHSWPEPLPGPK
jgi:hypothetical protein